MTGYILRRLLLMIPTLFGILALNFAIVQAAPGGPVERTLARLKGHGEDATARFSGAGGDLGSQTKAPTVDASSSASPGYVGAQGIDPEIVRQIEKMYGFDKPPLERFGLMIGNYLRFDFGESFYRNQPVVDLLLEKLPVSMSLGIWSTLLVYLISIPLGVWKATRHGTPFDTLSSVVVVVGYAIPSFLFAILLLVLFAGGSYWQLFPLRGLVSDNWHDLSWPARIADYFWHLALPLFSLVVGSFATLTLLTKNSFLDEIRKTYVLTARAKGLPEWRVLYGHVFRNAMLVVIAGFPQALLRLFFTGALLIEVIFSLDGLGLLGFEAALNRDYPVMFGTLYLFTLLGLLFNLLGDLTYVLVDPRIDFSRREA